MQECCSSFWGLMVMVVAAQWILTAQSFWRCSQTYCLSFPVSVRLTCTERFITSSDFLSSYSPFPPPFPHLLPYPTPSFTLLLLPPFHFFFFPTPPCSILLPSLSSSTPLHPFQHSTLSSLLSSFLSCPNPGAIWRLQWCEGASGVPEA